MFAQRNCSCGADGAAKWAQAYTIDMWRSHAMDNPSFIPFPWASDEMLARLYRIDSNNNMKDLDSLAHKKVNTFSPYIVPLTRYCELQWNLADMLCLCASHVWQRIENIGFCSASNMEKGWAHMLTNFEMSCYYQLCNVFKCMYLSLCTRVSVDWSRASINTLALSSEWPVTSVFLQLNQFWYF